VLPLASRASLPALLLCSLLSLTACAADGPIEPAPPMSPAALDGDWTGHYLVPGETPQSLTLRNVRTQGDTVTGEIVREPGRFAPMPTRFTGRILGNVLQLRDGLGTDVTLKLGTGDLLQGEIVMLGRGIPRRGTISLTRMRR
jgi:hypothetical protein